MPTTTNLTNESVDFSALYRRLLGGPQSDKRLHGDSLQLLEQRLQGANILDIGCGRGAMTEKMLSRGPRSMLITDYVEAQVKRVTERLRPKAGDTELLGSRLDIAGDLSELDGRQFDVITVLSVLMHLPPEESAKAIARIARQVAPGGVALVAVIARSVAEEFYIPATSAGADLFYPAMTGFAPGATEQDVIADDMDLSVLREYYPVDEHYRNACDATGLHVTEHDLIAGDECLFPSKSGNPCPYAPLVERGQALWKLWELRKT